MANTIKPSPLLLSDEAVSPVQDALAALAWLDNVYGVAEPRVRVRDGRRLSYPGVPDAHGNYVDLTPHGVHGNYCYFTRTGLAEVTYQRPAVLEAEFDLNVWLDLQAAGLGTTEEAVAGVLERLKHAPGLVRHVKYGLSFDELESQYLMWPYTGFAVRLVLRYKAPCLG